MSNSPISGSPSTTTPSPPTSSAHKQSRPTLSPSQLARHSQGAVDTRYIVSPNMRAAGFVPLAHTPLNQPFNASLPSSSTSSSVPTPIDPPRFPPIVFINPSNITSTPMWDYQRTSSYGLGNGTSVGLGFAPVDVSARVSVLSPLPASQGDSSTSVSSANVSNSNVHLFSSLSLLNKSLSPSVSTSSSKTSLTSISSSSERLSSKDKSTHRVLQSTRVHDAPVDGYPFPRTPPRTTSHGSHSPVALYSQGLAPVNNTPSTAGSTASGSVTPLAPSPSSSVTSLPTSRQSASTPSLGSGSTSPVPRAHAKRAQKMPKSKSSKSTPRPVLSLTELCSMSPSAWVTGSTLLPPLGPTTVRRDAASGRSRSTASRLVPGRTASGVQMDNKALQKVVEMPEGEQKRERTKAKEVGVEDKDDLSSQVPVAETAEVLPSLLPVISLDSDEKDELKVAKKKEKHRGREKDRDRDREKEREKEQERRRLKGKHKKAPSSSPTSTTPSPGHDGKEKDTASLRRVKDRRSTKERVLGQGYSSYTFPPREANPTDSHAHVLGQHDAAFEREKARMAGELAKGKVLAHRERDRQYARQTEMWLPEYEKDSIRGKKRTTAADFAPGMFSSAYAVGRGRGVGRGEHPSMRGRSVSAVSVVSSTLSDGETMVQDTHGTFEAELPA
ncbi:hypothetical protein PHLCEN_2v10457 [Hermanssonia centrifuga]|uniref:Uncharacterized protein n=1 Tax=Hermanssonia centrifuga TaxID=98765 RepID=A0A2R6NMD2_9APHY|nr:hypothetical protein PHLCEN_2v10457 [Hermanssonia centrifuga]